MIIIKLIKKNDHFHEKKIKFRNLLPLYLILLYLLGCNNEFLCIFTNHRLCLYFGILANS